MEFEEPAMRNVVIKIAAPKPRNPTHAILASKRGGSHRKSEKSERSKANLEAKKQAAGPQR